MNSASICREETDNGRRCGLNHGHHGDYLCCLLHAPREVFERPEEARWKS